MDFKLHSQFRPTGDQPQAIEALTRGLNMGLSDLLEILDRTGVMRKCPLHVSGGITHVVIFLHCLKHFFFDIRLNDLHSFHVFHMIGAEGRILLQPVLSLQRSRRKLIAVYKIHLIFFIHLSCSPLTAKIRSMDQMHFHLWQVPYPFR